MNRQAQKNAPVYQKRLNLTNRLDKMLLTIHRSDGEMVDTRDLKSLARKGVPVRVRLRACQTARG